MANTNITVAKKNGFCLGLFDAMASPCEILVDGSNLTLTRQLTQIAGDEAKRIEEKFSRYNPDSLCWAINNSQGKAVTIDQETWQLLEFAHQCYLISDGQFDITSGVLRKVWTFDGSDGVPTTDAINAILPLIGWQKVRYDQISVTLPAQMQLDFGGIGKEYAVDRVTALLRKAAPEVSVVVNFGGDICLTRAKADKTPWTIGIENPDEAGKPRSAALSIIQGALATSGDARRYLLKDGTRYSHILNPKTGWPIDDAPRSVTVAAGQCIEAGILATVALLHGVDAAAFLAAQGVKYWIQQ
ncbi:MAG: thiamine biosynthesis lipoprotein [Phenylobacterium sp.]